MAREELKPTSRRELDGYLALREAAEKMPAVVLASAIFVLLVAAALSAPVGAVPIPWKNCGAPGDSLQITKADASVWPPSAAAPARATATFDAAGNLLDLRLLLIQGVSWTFDSGPLPTTTSAGFVSLPASFPVNVTSPVLPLAAGPYSTTQTFTDNGASVTIAEKANLAAPVNAPVTTTVGLSFNGTPGFPLVPAAGDVYDIHVQMNESGGAGIFCMDMVVPFKTATPFVSSQQVADTPTLSTAGVITLVVMLLATGLFAGARQNFKGFEQSRPFLIRRMKVRVRRMKVRGLDVA